MDKNDYKEYIGAQMKDAIRIGYGSVLDIYGDAVIVGIGHKYDLLRILIFSESAAKQRKGHDGQTGVLIAIGGRDARYNYGHWWITTKDIDLDKMVVKTQNLENANLKRELDKLYKEKSDIEDKINQIEAKMPKVVLEPSVRKIELED